MSSSQPFGDQICMLSCPLSTPTRPHLSYPRSPSQSRKSGVFVSCQPGGEDASASDSQMSRSTTIMAFIYSASIYNFSQVLQCGRFPFPPPASLTLQPHHIHRPRVLVTTETIDLGRRTLSRVREVGSVLYLNKQNAS